MKDRIKENLHGLAAEGRIGLIPFVTAGYPSLDMTLDIVRAVVEAGADVVELGVPFSDPLAEGPTIQRSSHLALEQGVTPGDCIATAARLRSAGVKAPLVLMGYYNPVLSMGVDEFCRRAGDAGVDGLIVADLPADESGPLREAAGASGVGVIPLLALTSTEERIRAACRHARGFVYCVSLLGVTGARRELSERIEGLVSRVRRHTDLPVAVGFGVSRPEHVRSIARYADAAVVGSALIDAIDAGPRDTAAERAGAFTAGLRAATERPAK
ncbi:MAG: tryptophan synthase subunit alpha [Gemmatimonadetes bacterium]|nr:tryptophan synthase subunit alpha [Gemmatimonadota bacterium]